jgi:SAM-dependent methyltransferase
MRDIFLKTKLNVGCGTDIKQDYINLDVVNLPGVDVVHDLTVFPWPFEDNAFDEIELINVLEHLPDTVRTIEEIHRIARFRAKIIIRVPFWNSPDMFADPTHKRFFSERTLRFFDPNLIECKSRPYYTDARFSIKRTYAYIRCIRYVKLGTQLFTIPLFFLARHFCGVVWVVEFELYVEK